MSVKPRCVPTRVPERVAACSYFSTGRDIQIVKMLRAPAEGWSATHSKENNILFINLSWLLMQRGDVLHLKRDRASIFSLLLLTILVFTVRSWAHCKKRRKCRFIAERGDLLLLRGRREKKYNKIKSSVKCDIKIILHANSSPNK